MSRPLRITFSGAVYHITSRGNARQKIYRNDQDRELFLSILSKVVNRYTWLCYDLFGAVGMIGLGVWSLLTDESGEKSKQSTETDLETHVPRSISYKKAA